MKLFAVLLLSLGAVEGFAFWWMHPAPVGLCQPVLAYRPREVKAETLNEGEEQASAHSSTFDLRPSTFDSSTYTPLPEIYARSAPMLRCSGGQVFRVELNDSLTLHLGFFEWDGTDTGSVLEAFRHMPEACMGSIGMQLVSKEKPISYIVRGRETGDASRSESLKLESQKSDSKTTRRLSSSSSDLRRSDLKTIDSPSSSLTHSKSNIQNPTLATQSLSFDHTLFRDPAQAGGAFGPGPLIHAFRAIWVSGLDQSDARQGLSGTEFNRLRTIRLHSALTRFRPAHARVIQGTVRGAPSADAAWQAFEQAMLKDLSFTR